MSIQYNADEALSIAEQVEKNGDRFYRAAAEKQTDRDAAATFLKLAEMEQGHLKVFSDMRAALSDEERRPVTFDPYDENSLYLRAAADRTIFDVTADLTKSLTGKETIGQVLAMGIAAEKDSIVFYTGMKDMVPARLGRDRIEAIIKEELSHFVTLSEMVARAK
jgi:rubrerythrin